MNVRVQKESGAVRLAIDGEMTIYGVSELKTALLNGLLCTPMLELDLKDVTAIDSAGLQLLLLARKEAGLMNKTVRIAAMSRAVENILEVYRLKETF